MMNSPLLRSHLRRVLAVCGLAVSLTLVGALPAAAATAPDAPTGLAAVVAATSSVTLSWTAPASDGGSPITGYSIQRTNVSEAPGFPIYISTGTSATSYVVAPYAASARYAVAAINASGTGPYTPTVDAPIYQVPSAPTNAVAAASSGQLSVTWTAPVWPLTGGLYPPVTGYVATTTDTTTPANGGQTCSSASAPNCIITGLTNGDAYTVTVVATDFAGTGTASTPSAAATPVGIPGPPTGLVATVAATSSVTLTWVAPASTGGSPITGYSIQRQDVTDSPLAPFVLVANTGTTATSYVVTNGTSARYAVAAINSAGTGPWSAQVSAPLYQAPPTPTGVVATPGSGQLSVTWSPGIVGVTGQILPATTGYVATATGGQTCSAAVPTTNCVITGLVNGDVYTVTVVAVNFTGPGLPSIPSASTTPVPVSGAPTGLVATVAPTSSVTLTWTAPASTVGSPITGYAVQRTNVSEVPTSPFILTANTGSTSTSYVVVGGTSARYAVAAITTSGTGPWSALASAPIYQAPPIPSGVVVTPSAGQLSVAWTPGIVGVTGQLLPVTTGYVATATTSAVGSHTCSATAPATSCVVTGLVNGAAYTVTVVAVNFTGPGLPSSPIVAITPFNPPPKIAASPSPFVSTTSTSLTAPGRQVLTRLAARIAAGRDTHVVISSYATGRSSRVADLSSARSRALTVENYLRTYFAARHIRVAFSVLTYVGASRVHVRAY